MSPRTFTLLAPAKINLFLHILGRRADGYHLLQSVMVFVTVGDRLTFTRHDSLFIDIEGPYAGDVAAPKDNLVYKAAQALAAEYKVPAVAEIRLEKNLPVASGMGGGSSDAATTLKGLAQLWGLPEEQGRMQKLAATIGADVPACLMRKPVWAEGIGEKMMRLTDMPDMNLVLVTPPTPTPTPEVFKQYQRNFSPPIQFMGRRKSMHEWIADLKIYRNDLTEAAVRVSPEIRPALQSLRETTGCHIARLSGSGATCFGIYENAAAAAAAVNKLKQIHPGWWITTAGLLRE